LCAGDLPGALEAYASAIEVQPDDYQAYLERADFRRYADPAGELADVEAAMNLTPHTNHGALTLAEIRANAGDYTAALATLDAALAAQPDDERVKLLAARGIVQARRSKPQQAALDFAAAADLATGPRPLNHLCWVKARAGVDLEAALKDCDSALCFVPFSYTFLDSRGYVLLRLGRHAESIASYDAALKYFPLEAPSLYGRSLAKRALGDSAGADADLRAARQVDAHVVEEFEGRSIEF
jgi:tetratricopeptide (TPR) repeat protein